DLAGEAVDHAGLQALDGVLADHPGWPDQLHLAQLGRAGGQRVDGDLDAGGERAAQVLAAGGDHVEVRRGTEVHDDRRAAVQGVRGERVRDPVGADLLRVVDRELYPGPDARLQDLRRHAAVVPAQHRAQVAQ